jgi:hypothetical protein
VSPRRRKEDQYTLWDWLVHMLKDLCYALGLVALGAGLALGAVYLGTQAKEPSVTTPDCGSCKRGENTK